MSEPYIARIPHLLSDWAVSAVARSCHRRLALRWLPSVSRPEYRSLRLRSSRYSSRTYLGVRGCHTAIRRLPVRRYAQWRRLHSAHQWRALRISEGLQCASVDLRAPEACVRACFVPRSACFVPRSARCNLTIVRTIVSYNDLPRASFPAARTSQPDYRWLRLRSSNYSSVGRISEFEGVAGPSAAPLYVGMRSGGGRVARACINGERRRATSVCPRAPGDGLGIPERTLGPILATRQTPQLMDM